MESGICAPSEQGQKEAFLNGLSQFLSDKGRYICKAPKLAGKVIDLHDLYNRVTSVGGYQKVTDRGLWDEFLDQYGFPAISVTLAYGLQKIYQMYLEEYEKVHHFGDDEISLFSRSFVGYKRFRYAISDTQRIQNNMNMEKPLVSDYDRVVLSLESCLPNEIDFAVNACTLLSGESRHVLRLPQCRRIVDALLLHAGIVSDGYDSYSEVLKELQKKTLHDFRRFWKTSVTKKSILTVLLPPMNDENVNKESFPKTDNHIPDAAASAPESAAQKDAEEKEETFVETLQERLIAIQHKMPDGQKRDVHKSDIASSKWADLFHGHRLLGVQDYEGQRVLQIALVLLNLSFEDFNVVLLARHPSLVRFVFLCIHSRYSCLRQTGLDILSNISSHIQLIHLHYDIAAMLFDTVHGVLLSEDKFERIRGFEILGNICRTRVNGDHVCVAVCDEVYEAMVRNLLVYDVELLLSAIESLYRLSKLGETTCTKIIFVRGCVDILMCLITLNVRTFGPEKLSEIRLARRIAPGMQQQSMQQQSCQVPNHATPMHPSHGPVFPRPMHYQHPKLGSVHQARPTFAPAANIQPTPTAPHIKPPPPQPTRTPQPTPILVSKVQQKPASAPSKPTPVVPTPPPQDPPPVAQKHMQTKVPLASTQQQSAIRSSTPSTTTPAIMKTPPGAGAIYTHPEMGTVPPVYHYMPAPPSDIAQDNSPESFTQLWIWATYEFEMESYIPRVDVYCEYLASSNRYGRQGKTEVLSATDFGRCLKAIFPQASSRLFNQGRGQPQYHIAGIKKRATPFPVPGYQLKDPVSVFSSEYQKIPVTRPPVTAQSTSGVKTANSQVASVTSTTTINTAVTSVPIQQLQFQPIMVMPLVPGNPASQAIPTAPSVPQVSSSLVTIPTSSSSAIDNSQIPSDVSGCMPVAATGEIPAADGTGQGAQKTECASVSVSTATVAASLTSGPVNISCTVSNSTTTADSETITISDDAVSLDDSTKSKLLGTNTRDLPVASDSVEKTRRTSPVGENTNSAALAKNPETLSSDSIHSKGAENTVQDDKRTEENGNSCHSAFTNHEEQADAMQVNGFPEPDVPDDVQSVQPGAVIAKQTPMETDGDCEDNSKISKSKQNLKKSEDNCELIMNGYSEECEGDKRPSVPSTQSNGLNGETEHSNRQKSNCFVNGQPDSTVLQPEAPATVTPPPVLITCTHAPPATTMTTPSHTTTPVMCTATSTNLLPHSALNQRLKDTITRRKNSQMATPTGSGGAAAGSTTPVNTTLPPSLIQQYSYKQQSKPMVEDVDESATLAQKIIPVTPNEIPQQYAFQRHQPATVQNKPQVAPPASLSAGSRPLPQFAPQTGSKRPNPHPAVTVDAPSAKVLRSSRNLPPRPVVMTHVQTPSVVARPPYVPVRQQMTPIAAKRLPNGQMIQHHPHGIAVRPGSPSVNPHHPAPPPVSQKVKPPTIDLMAPNASLLVLYRNVGKIPFANHLDEKEDAISKSIRLTACLILANIARYSDLGRSMLQRHESHLASVAMSQMDCSPIVSRLLSDMEL